MHPSFSVHVEELCLQATGKDQHEILLHSQQNSKLLGSEFLAFLSAGLSDSIYLTNYTEPHKSQRCIPVKKSVWSL